MYKLTDWKTEVSGELKERIEKNAARLSSPCYRKEAIYSADQAGWPGDWEGRTILALVSLWRASGSKPAYIDSIIEDLPSHFNEKGCLGPLPDAENIDEQQLSGHNWLVRGLYEYYLLTGDQSVYAAAERIVRNLYLPFRGRYYSYPTDPALRGRDGSYSGKTAGKSGSWKFSSDTGCAFMCLDALEQINGKMRSPELTALLGEMVSVFGSIDLAGTQMQTHATLSALRGIITLYETSGERGYLETAENIYNVYISSGMTETFANFNWFGRFDTWTEPCAIVDSMIASLELFRLTGKEMYLSFASKIWYNGICRAQRCNGGFGTDTCAGPAGDYIAPSSSGISEAFWCCTMRGAEGLRKRTDYTVLVSEGGDVLLPFTTDCDIDAGNFRISVRSRLPYEGSFTVTVLAAENNTDPVCFSLKAYAAGKTFEYRVCLGAGGKAVFSESFTPEITRVRSKDGRKFKYMCGDLLLASAGNAEKAEPAVMYPLTGMRDLTPEETASDRRRVLFDD